MNQTLADGLVRYLQATQNPLPKDVTVNGFEVCDGQSLPATIEIWWECTTGYQHTTIDDIEQFLIDLIGALT